MAITVLALDLEATLVDNAFNAEPRTGFEAFLDYCHSHFERVALFTTVEEAGAREVIESLVRGGHCPSELADRLEYDDWSGEHKNLRFIPNVSPEEAVLVDDDACWICRDQTEQWIPIAPWDGVPDSELTNVKQQLVDRSREK